MEQMDFWVVLEVEVVLTEEEEDVLLVKIQPYHSEMQAAVSKPIDIMVHRLGEVVQAEVVKMLFTQDSDKVDSE
jgi:hypothetical protein